MSLAPILLAAIQLVGVTGERLRARAFFDANNVKVGDPLVLTVDFVGEADFAALHPPALSREVGRADWKLDDASAKTDTYRDARRLTYRVRPMREGVLWFPELEFEYAGPGGERRTVRSNAIPVHAKPGADVVVAGMGEDEEAMPAPDGLVVEPPPLSEDDLFAWRKACAEPSADAFARFDFPAAKMNEARCAILAGDWKRALKVYSRLEWTTGQTPAMERGIVAALALKYQNAAAELPVWRQVGRPLLRYGWRGRAGLVFGGAAALALVFWLLGRAIRALACAALALLAAWPALAQMADPFAEMEEMHRQMQRRMQQMMGGGGFSFSFGGEEVPPVEIKATVETSRDDIQVGDTFEFILSLERPRGVTVGQIQIDPSERFGLQITGPAENLVDGKGSSPSSVVSRIAIPVRYDVPFRGRITFGVNGMATGRVTRDGGRSSFTFSNSFQTRTPPVDVEVKPLPSDGQPPGFGGIIAERLRIAETTDVKTVETNDVVQITYRLDYVGYLPEEWMPEGAAFEWGRSGPERDGSGSAEWRRYFIADGRAETPSVEVVYYDPSERRYRTARTAPTRLSYR